VRTSSADDDVQFLSHIWVGLTAPNLAELEVAKQPGQQEGAAMTETTPSPLNNVITIDDDRIKNHLERVVRGSVEESSSNSRAKKSRAPPRSRRKGCSRGMMVIPLLLAQRASAACPRQCGISTLVAIRFARSGSVVLCSHASSNRHCRLSRAPSGRSSVT